MVGFCVFRVLLFTLDACFTRTMVFLVFQMLYFFAKNGAFYTLFWGCYVFP